MLNKRQNMNINYWHSIAWDNIRPSRNTGMRCRYSKSVYITGQTGTYENLDSHRHCTRERKPKITLEMILIFRFHTYSYISTWSKFLSFIVSLRYDNISRSLLHPNRDHSTMDRRTYYDRLIVHCCIAVISHYYLLLINDAIDRY